MSPSRKASSKSTKRSKRSAAEAREVAASEAQAVTELNGILDNVKATVIALSASLADKERSLRETLHVQPTEGGATGLADVIVLRKWADRTLRTIEVFERGHPGGLEDLVAELGEFDQLVHSQDLQPPPLARS